MRAAKVQASLRIRAVSPEPSLLAHTNSESRGTFRQKSRSLAPLNGWACAVKVCHDGMLEDTNSLDGAHLIFISSSYPRYGKKSQNQIIKPEDHWSCIAHPSADDMLKSVVFEENKFKHSPRVGADNPLGPNILCHQEGLITMVICCNFKKNLFNL